MLFRSRSGSRRATATLCLRRPGGRLCRRTFARLQSPRACAAQCLFHCASARSRRGRPRSTESLEVQSRRVSPWRLWQQGSSKRQRHMCRGNQKRNEHTRIEVFNARSPFGGRHQAEMPQTPRQYLSFNNYLLGAEHGACLPHLLCDALFASSAQ